jgi:hypothetical protein
MSACIIPLAPDFQDPPPVPASPAPALSGFMPQNFGSTVSIPATFGATAIDPNLADTLYVRWIIDYPPYTANTLVLPTGTQSLTPPGQATISQPITCTFNNVLAPSVDSKHKLELIVGTQDFVANTCGISNANCLDEIVGGGPVARAAWTIVMSCPAGP